MSHTGDDRGDIVLGWLTKVVLALGVFGLLGFDVVSLLQAQFQAADRATTAAVAASGEYAASKDVQKAYNAALATTADGDTIEASTFTVGSDGVVRLRLHHTGTTLLVHRVPQLRHFAEAIGKAESGPH